MLVGEFLQFIAAKQPARKKQISSAQLIGRISTLITLILIGGVVFYAAEFLMTK